MSNYAYSEKLRHPKWQKKRLSILERADWKCQCCGNEDENLQIHHLIYSKGEPWDAPDNTLECLCHVCHEFREDWNKLFAGRCTIPTSLAWNVYIMFGVLFDGAVPVDPSVTTVIGLYIESFKFHYPNQNLPWIKPEKSSELDRETATVVPRGTSPSETPTEQDGADLVNQQQEEPPFPGNSGAVLPDIPQTEAGLTARPQQTSAIA